MKHPTLKALIVIVRLCTVMLILALISLFLFSFTIFTQGDDFLKHLGIDKPAANEKISNSILGGYIDAYGAKNAKNIALGNRAAVATDLLTYTKKYVGSPAFVQKYTEMKEREKPVPNTIQTPEEMQQNAVKQYQKSVLEMEKLVKNANPALKPAFEKALGDSKKLLKDAEDPNNKAFVAYRKNYEGMVRNNKLLWEKQMSEWDKKYPANHLLYIKPRLQEFMEETKDIDFNAALMDKGGKKIFVNPVYERKSERWKMGFRAGKEVVEPSRKIVQQWLDEIN